MKTVNRMLAGVAAAAMLTSPLAAADFGYDMGLEAEAETYGGLYYAIPFQGRTDRETREGATLGFQVDRNAGAAIDPFDRANGLQDKAMLDVSFDSSFTLNKMLVNGLDTVSLYDKLYQTGGEGGALGGYGAVAAVAVVVGGALLVNNQMDDNNDCPPRKRKSDPDFTDAVYSDEVRRECAREDDEE